MPLGTGQAESCRAKTPASFHQRHSALRFSFNACLRQKDKTQKGEQNSIMPRPRKQKALKRGHKLTIRLDDAEYGYVHSESEKIGVTLSAYSRAKLIKGVVRIPRYARIDTQSVNQLSKLGGLFMKTHNESGGIYSEKTAKILDVIYDIMTEIDRGLTDDRETHSEPQNT
jgi:hypothetical protein